MLCTRAGIEEEKTIFHTRVNSDIYTVATLIILSNLIFLSFSSYLYVIIQSVRARLCGYLSPKSCLPLTMATVVVHSVFESPLFYIILLLLPSLIFIILTFLPSIVLIFILLESTYPTVYKLYTPRVVVRFDIINTLADSFFVFLFSSELLSVTSNFGF